MDKELEKTIAQALIGEGVRRVTAEITKLEMVADAAGDKSMLDVVRIMYEALGCEGIIRDTRTGTPELRMMAQTVLNGFLEHANNPYFKELIADDVASISPERRAEIEKDIEERLKGK